MFLNHALWNLLNPVLFWTCHGLPRLLLSALRFSIFIFSYLTHPPPVVRFASRLTRCLSAPGLHGSCEPRSLLALDSIDVRRSAHWLPIFAPLRNCHFRRLIYRVAGLSLSSRIPVCSHDKINARIPCISDPPLRTSANESCLPAPTEKASPREDQGAAETTQVIVDT